MNLPKKINMGDQLGITAPASPLEESLVLKAKEQLEAWGFKVKLGITCFENYGYLSGSDQIRAQELNDFFYDSNIKGIIALRGGYGTLRILDKLNYDIIKRNPKPFVGFSDITALHIAFNQRCQLVTFHGPMAVQIAQGLDPLSKTCLLRSLGFAGSLAFEKLEPLENVNFIIPGTAEGPIVGGNLSLVAATLGTPYEIDTKNKLLFLEEVREAPYRIDRLLTQLGLAGKLSDAAGFILGDFNQEQATEPWPVFYERLKPYCKPVIWGIRAGHCTPNITIPLGIRARISSCDQSLKFLEGAVLHDTTTDYKG